MLLTHWFRAPRRLLTIFVAVMIVPAAGLAWLGWRFIEQDRALENQRDRESLERTADLISASLSRRVSGWLEQLPSAFSEPLGSDALAVRFASDGILAQRGVPLLYHPVVPPHTEAPAATFAVGEALEFQARDYVKAIAEFERLAQSKDPKVQAGALLRLARNLRNANRLPASLKAYDRLAEVEAATLNDLPASMLAAFEVCAVLEKLGRQTELQNAARTLHVDLQRGRWKLDRDSWEYYSREAARWAGGSAVSSRTAQALTAAVDWLWVFRKNQDAANVQGVRSMRILEQPVTVLWRSAGEEVTAIAATPAYLERRLRDTWDGYRVRLTLTDSEGHAVLGSLSQAGSLQAVRAASDTRLPWTLRITSAASEAVPLEGRRRTLIAAFGLAVSLVLAAGYFTARAIARELAVSRLQSDFVSAVSHEFRTPITALGHLTELLQGGKVSAEETRQRFYPALARETERLHRLVETLLNFGRMEAGAIEYSFETLDLNELVQGVLAEFRSDLLLNGQRIEVRAAHSPLPVRADRDLLGRALWNLLENAVKYAPNAPLIEVGVTQETNGVALRVRDEGPGIAVAEQELIFQKFVRGSASKAANVKGTGIGLAMVQHIARAHHGHVSVTSEPGHGSTFTILLPSAERGS